VPTKTSVPNNYSARLIAYNRKPKVILLTFNPGQRIFWWITLKKKHHRYAEKNIPVVKQYLEKIGQVHGHNHPELLKIAALLTASARELTAH